MGHDEAPSGENPFSARRLRPGALPFLFPPDQSAAQLLNRLRANDWRGQIVGPHGSGKSALLAALTSALQAAGRRVHMVELHNGQRRLPRDFYRTCGCDPATVVVVDGYEQLGWLSRFWLKRFCRRHKLGFLVTAHNPVGLPDLFRSATTLALAEQIVAQLLGDRPKHVTVPEVAERFSRHGGDLREMLFDLYDLYEQRRRGG
jgi:hypothetical protein